MWPRSCTRFRFARCRLPARYDEHRSSSISHRIPSSAAPGIVSKPPARFVFTTSLTKPLRIRTLSPAKLTDTEALDISGKSEPRIHTPFGLLRLPYYYHLGDHRFPPGTSGFLYFTSPPADPSIRFRIVHGGNPADFDNGRDLLLPDGVTPWCVSRKTFTRAKKAAALGQLIAYEGLAGGGTSSARWPYSLDPARVIPLNIVTLSGRSPYVYLPQGTIQLCYIDKNKDDFPEGTRGFLYFDIASLSVRFRVAHESMDFAKGSDLLLRDGRTPWRIPLYRVASGQMYAPLRQQLLLDGLVSERQLLSRTFVVSTLDCTRLTDTDWLDLSGMAAPTISVQERCVLEVQSTSRSRFPSHARGFLYWHVPKDDPYGAEVRFRCAESLEHFLQGHDLWTPELEQPWSIRLRGLAQQTTSHSQRLLAYLKQAGLVDESLIEHHAKTVVTHMHDVLLVRFCVGSLSVGLRAGALSCTILFQGMPWVNVCNGAALARLVVLKDTETTIVLGLRVVTLLDGPRMISDGKAPRDLLPSDELARDLLARSVLPEADQLIYGRGYNHSSGRTHSWKKVRSLVVRKSSKEGRVLMKIMEHSGDDMDRPSGVDMYRQRVHRGLYAQRLYRRRYA
ncbi:hypothetical protein BD626DRAFT_509864 [Schizophyllum amplum]|uniref:Uncharacterized protein n=1 Tax=Schizophyllum amplum TaxID=97359 RepID=A0A550C2B8_9AGAR|nr:hypothetical protein BD626DRAFT_509864 [Auriculariopsis ampla]